MKINRIVRRLEEIENKIKVILNLIQVLPRLLLPLRNNNDLSGRFRIKYAMTSILKEEAPGLRPSGVPFRSGFTLIELLVVVLIIGILAAVALPQYNKAVWRARFIQAKIMTQTIAHAQEVYYMANGQYSTSFKELDISVPTDDIRLGKYAYFPWGMCELYTKTTNTLNEIVCRISAHGDYYLSYHLALEHNDSNAGRTVCVAYSKDESAINYQVCANETKKRKGVSWSSNATGFVYP